MGQRRMDKPPTKAKRSAFDDQAKELGKRLRQLVSDYAALFLRYPNAEGRPSVEALEKMQVLAALRVHPWRKKLAAQANRLERASFLEKFPFKGGDNWLLQMWIDGVPEILERGDWDVDFAARNLITTLHASLRVRCPGYPALEDRDAFTAATAAVASKIRDKVNEAAANDSERCQDPDAIAIGRLALEALGYEGARHLRLLGSPERRPKV